MCHDLLLFLMFTRVYLMDVANIQVVLIKSNWKLTLVGRLEIVNRTVNVLYNYTEVLLNVK